MSNYIVMGYKRAIGRLGNGFVTKNDYIIARPENMKNIIANRDKQIERRGR